MSTVIQHQYLSFKVNKEIYALEVGSVREVLEYTDVMRIPRMPSFMRGVINLRGSVVPLVDLRNKFQLESIEPTVNTSIIVVEMEVNEEVLVFGLISDSVDAVLEFSAEDILPAPNIGASIDTSLIKGMGKQEDKFLIILDLENLMTFEELKEIIPDS